MLSTSCFNALRACYANTDRRRHPIHKLTLSSQQFLTDLSLRSDCATRTLRERGLSSFYTLNSYKPVQIKAFSVDDRNLNTIVNWDRICPQLPVQSHNADTCTQSDGGIHRIHSQLLPKLVYGSLAFQTRSNLLSQPCRGSWLNRL